MRVPGNSIPAPAESKRARGPDIPGAATEGDWVGMVRACRIVLRTLAVLLPVGALPGSLEASQHGDRNPEEPVRLARQPAVSPDGAEVCFGYQGHLWIAPVSGGPARRLTAGVGDDSRPRWSPDARWIAFNSDREGGTQVFIVPALGGPARQVTEHSVATHVHDWFPDGKSLLVTSLRETRRSAIYRLEIETGRLYRLLSDDSGVYYPSLSPDGRWLAYQRGALLDLIRSGYEGSANFDVYWLPTDGSAPPSRLTDSPRNDTYPLWGADNRTIYFVSERDGASRLWRQSRAGGRPERVLGRSPAPIHFPTLARTKPVAVFEAGGDLYSAVLPAAGSPDKVAVLCRTDLRQPVTSLQEFDGTGVQDFSLSPDGGRVAMKIRGDLFVAAVDRKAEARRLTDTPEAESEPAWLPDGRSLVFSARREGSHRILSVGLATGEVRPLSSAGFIDSLPRPSPDGRWIAFLRGPETGIWAVRPDGTGERRVIPGPKIDDFRWSPDGRWLAYVREDEIRNEDVWLAPLEVSADSLAAGTPVNATAHPGYNRSPHWSPDGKKLVFRSNRYRNRDIETVNHQGRFSLYTLPLEPEKADLSEPDLTAPPPPKKDPEPAPPVTVQVDPERIELRARQVFAMEEDARALSISPDGKTYLAVLRSLGKSDLWQVSSDGANLQRLTTSGEGPSEIYWAADSSRFYWLSGDRIRWLPRGGGTGGSVAFTTRMEVRRTVLREAAFDEAWQLLNDRFYDRTFRGKSWREIGDRFRPLLAHAETDPDFRQVVSLMLGELNASHLAIRGAAARPPRDTGYLGIRLDEHYGGPGVRVAGIVPQGPASLAESRIEAGEVILTVEGRPVSPGLIFDRALSGTAGRAVTLTVRAGAPESPVRPVRIRPIAFRAFQDLLYEEWVAGRRKAATELSAGRLAYVHVRDMGDTARNRFERELFSLGQRAEGLVLDVRDNEGGDTHDSLLRILARNRHYFTFAPRTETPFPQPERAYVKPVILLINEGSLSDAEVFANGFRELGLGKIVGTPTMGWIIFTYRVTLVDGSTFGVPHLGCLTTDGRDMENWGVPPDIRVEATPADHARGRDPQLERAVRELLADPRLGAPRKR